MFQEFPENNNNDEDFLNEFRQKLANQSNQRYEEKQKEMQRSKSVFLGAIAGVGLACVVGWFALSPQSTDSETVEVPTIRRPETAVKVKPSEPGGMEILNQDKTVYNIIDKSDEGKKGENLLPPPEEPKAPELSPEVDTIADIIDNIEKQEKIVETRAEVKEVVDAPEAKTITISEASKTIETKADSTTVTEEKKVEVIKVEPKKEEPKTASKVEVKKEEPKKVEAPKPEVKKASTPKTESTKPTTAASGNWQVQLMSSKNKDAVEKAWKDQVKKYPPLAGHSYEIETADIDFDNTFYRLKAGTFTQKADADKLCSQVKALGGSCLVTKKK